MLMNNYSYDKSYSGEFTRDKYINFLEDVLETWFINEGMSTPPNIGGTSLLDIKGTVDIVVADDANIKKMVINIATGIYNFWSGVNSSVSVSVGSNDPTGTTSLVTPGAEWIPTLADKLLSNSSSRSIQSYYDFLELIYLEVMKLTWSTIEKKKDDQSPVTIVTKLQ